MNLTTSITSHTGGPNVAESVVFLLFTCLPGVRPACNTTKIGTGLKKSQLTQRHRQAGLRRLPGLLSIPRLPNEHLDDKNKRPVRDVLRTSLPS